MRPLGAYEAVFFNSGLGTYLSINDSDAAFNPSTDLVAEVSRMTFAHGDANAGVLAVDNYFV